ncbi:MAG: Omp28-related outer membrane protein, partial [Bacteroidota bacterium]
GRDGFENYYYYSKAPTLPNYVHQFVLRKAGTDILGDVVPAESVVKGAKVSMDTRTIDLSGYDVDNCHVIAFVHYPMNGQKKIINAQQVKVGESIGIDR